MAPPRSNRARGARPTLPSRLEGSVKTMGHGGDAVVETEAGIVLAAGGAPGERVHVGKLRQRGGVLRAGSLDVVAPGRGRVTPACAIAQRCGGCPWMHLELAEQHALKRRWLQEAVQGLTTAEAVVSLEAPGPALRYRRRARLAWHNGGKPGRAPTLGYRGLHSAALIEATECIVLETALQETETMLRRELLGALVGSGELQLVHAHTPGTRPTSDPTNPVIVGVTTDSPQPAEAYTRLQTLVESGHLLGAWLQVGDGKEAVWGQQLITVSDHEQRALVAPASGFAQANASVNERLGALVTEFAEAADARVLELYAGHGNLSVALATRAAAFTAIEGHPAAAQACRANLRAHGCTTAQVRQGPVEMLAGERVDPGIDLVVLDPPRSGAKQVLPALLARKPRRFVYVSCDIPTLRRDLRTLAAAGYRVDRAVALDMFPQTAHVEAVIRAIAP